MGKWNISHPAYEAVMIMKDKVIAPRGFDSAVQCGLLASYMQMMNRGRSGGYSRYDIQMALQYWGVDVLRPAHRPARL